MARTLIAAGFLTAAAIIGWAPVASAAGQYANCSQAKSDGVCNIMQGSPDYASKLDRDGDGVACEC
jgi:hypothetical protein